MSRLFGAHLPRPEAGKLYIYLLGPGVGESQVVVFPDGRCMVVDGCTQGKVNLPAALLDHLAIRSIDALVLTHPDLDHLRGVAEVVRRFKPRKIFRYPALGYVRDFVAMWHDAHPSKRRYRELAEAIAVLDEHAGLDATHEDEPCISTHPWTPKGAPYTVHFLAPTPFDRDRVRLLWRKIVQFRAGRYVLSPRFERLMSGATRLGDAPNAVSLGLVIEWAERKVLLAGDVENGKRSSPKSGWKGVLRILDDPDNDRGHLVNDVDVVKVAHHGSRGAFFPDAWQRHALTRKTTAILAPFSPSPLPSDPTLLDLRSHCAHLGISAGGGDAFARARKAGWVDFPGANVTTTTPCLAAVLDPVAGLQLFRDGGAALFQGPPAYQRPYRPARTA
jgi:beta-lactamase superfamily II metal-dependent hydrolase